MTRFDSENLNAAHTQRELDQIPQSAPTAEKMAEAALARAGLVKRLRDELAAEKEAHKACEFMMQTNASMAADLADQLAAEKALADEYASSFSIGKHGGVIMRPAKVKVADAAYRKARGL